MNSTKLIRNVGRVFLPRIWIVVIGVGLPLTSVVAGQSQSTPCTTPTGQKGLCVAVQRCHQNQTSNIIEDRTPASAAGAAAACTEAGVERSICCQPSDVKERTNLLPTECGHSTPDLILIFPETAKVFAYPWMALLRYNTSSSGRFRIRCAGSLISKRYVLTAGHCLEKQDTLQSMQVRLGEHTLDQEPDCNTFAKMKDCAGPVEDFNVESFEVHPDFNKPRLNSDIGLIRLDRDVKFKDHIRPICLPTIPAYRSKRPSAYIVSGWGATERAVPWSVLLQAIVFPVNNVDCARKLAQHHYKVELNGGQMCAGGGRKGATCRGNSGAPLASYVRSRNGTRRFVQHGILSAGGHACGEEALPEIYCRVENYVDWILDTIRE